MAILLKAISDSDTILMVNDSSSFPAENAVIQIDNEQISYSTIYMGTLYGCTRGVNSTSSAPHAIHSQIRVVAFYLAPVPGEATSYPLLAPNGSNGTPSYAFAEQPNGGLFFEPAGQALIVSSNTFLILAGGILGIGASSYRESEAFQLRAGIAAGVPGCLDFQANTGVGDNVLRLLNDGTLMIYDGTQLQPITIGANNSGGAGFRKLTIPNA